MVATALRQKSLKGKQTQHIYSLDKMPNQNSGYSIIIPQVRDTASLFEQKQDKEKSHSIRKKSEYMFPT